MATLLGRKPFQTRSSMGTAPPFTQKFNGTKLKLGSLFQTRRQALKASKELRDDGINHRVVKLGTTIPKGTRVRIGSMRIGQSLAIVESASYAIYQ